MFSPQKFTNTITLPKIEDSIAHQNQRYFNSPKEGTPGIQSGLKPEKNMFAKASPIFTTDRDSPYIVGKKGIIPNKDYLGGRESSLLGASSKQNYILKKMEAQREILQKKPQFLGVQGLRESEVLYSNDKPGNLIGGRGDAFNNMYKERYNIPGSLSPAGEAAHGLLNLSPTEKSARPRNNTEPLSISKRKLELDGVSASVESINHMFTGKGRILQNAGFRSAASKYDKPKFPMLNAADEIGYYPEKEKIESKINIDLIVKIGDRLHLMFGEIENGQNLLTNLKEFLQLVDKEETLQVDALFFDTRMRRNLKTYLMLEKTCAFTLLYLLNNDGNVKTSPDIQMKSICHYMYGNFLNFVESIISKIETLPQFNQVDNAERLRLLVKKRPQEVDRSVSTEQINKLLLKILRTSFKNDRDRKTDRYSKIDLLLEKIEFGLMLNYHNELKSIFADLLLLYKIELKAHVSDSPGFEPHSANDKFNDVKKSKVQAGFNGKTEIPSRIPAAKAEQKRECFLPSPVPKLGQENKPIYTLVLDMDETLMHFEEIAGKGRFFVRPYAEKFLKEMSELFEVVIFTAGVQDYADKVLNILDPCNYISHRLYRHHVTLKNQTPGITKDLTKLGRDLTKTLIIDNAPENFRQQIDNGIEIKSWYNDPYDTELLDLMPFLRDLVIGQVEDVTKSIKRFKQKRRTNGK